jgi:hypothetical protein
VYQCQPSGYMVGPVGYHCTPACTDSAMWRSDFGDCSIYRATYTPGGFKDYCGADKDIAGEHALPAHASACAWGFGRRRICALLRCLLLDLFMYIMYTHTHTYIHMYDQEFLRRWRARCHVAHAG